MSLAIIGSPAGGAGGHPSTLYDATSGEPSLTADNDTLQIERGVDFHSHGLLFNEGPTVNGGPQPIWADPTAATYDAKGNFGFFYGGPFDVEAFEFWMAYGEDPALTMDMSPDVNTLNLFATATQAGADGSGALWIGWDSDGNRRASIGPYTDVDTWQIALYDPTMDDDIITSYTVVANGNATIGVAGNYGVGGSNGYAEFGSGKLDAGGTYFLGIAQPSQTTPLLNLLAANGSTAVFRVLPTGSFGAFGAAPPSQSAAGTTAADAIACLKAFGLMHA